MGRIYTVSFASVAATLAQDLFEIVAPADAIVAIHDICLSQSTELGDAAEEQLVLAWKSGQTTSGSGGTAPTAIPRQFGDAAFGGTVEVNNTTKASAGTIVTHHPWNWNIRGPFREIFTPETRPILSPSRRGTLELVNAPTDSVTISGFITFEEIGG